MSLLELYSGHFSDFAGQSQSQPPGRLLCILGFRDLVFRGFKVEGEGWGGFPFSLSFELLVPKA